MKPDLLKGVQLPKISGRPGSAGHDSSPQEGATYAFGEDDEGRQEIIRWLDMTAEYDRIMQKMTNEPFDIGWSNGKLLFIWMLNSDHGRYRLTWADSQFKLDAINDTGLYEYNVVPALEAAESDINQKVERWVKNSICHHVANRHVKALQLKQIALQAAQKRKAGKPK